MTKVLDNIRLVDIWISDRPGHPGGSPFTKQAVCRCGHPRSSHSYAREDDFKCEVCDDCSGFDADE